MLATAWLAREEMTGVWKKSHRLFFQTPVISSLASHAVASIAQNIPRGFDQRHAESSHRRSHAHRQNSARTPHSVLPAYHRRHLWGPPQFAPPRHETRHR